MITESTIESAKESTLLSDLARTYFPMKRRGGQFWACCPFHNESSASFSINDDKGMYKCWGCGVGGNIFRFVMEMEKLSFPEAVEFLCARAGLPVERGKSGALDDRRKRIGAALNEANAHFFSMLVGRAGDAVRPQIKVRGFTRELCERWDVGYAPKDYGLGSEDMEYMVGAGLAYDNGSLRFKDRIMFGIRNDSGALVGFSGRTTVNHPAKYLNTPETAVFSKGKILYGMDKARKKIIESGIVVVVEGQIDVIKCHAAGLDVAVAPLGTGFTASHASTIKRLCNEAVLVFDGDKAGREAARKAFAGLSSVGVTVRSVVLGEGEDPDSFLDRGGNLLKMVEEAKLYPEALALSLDCSTVERKEEALGLVAFALSCLEAGITRDDLSNRVAKIIGVKPSLLKKKALVGGGHISLPTTTIYGAPVSETESHLLAHLMQCGKEGALPYDWLLAGNQNVGIVMGWDYEAGNPSSLAPLLARLGPEVESAVGGITCEDVAGIDIKATYKSMVEAQMRVVAGEVANKTKQAVDLHPYLDTLKNL